MVKNKMTQKYNSRQKYGTGWFNDSARHSLARQGIKTGRKDYARAIPRMTTVSYQPTVIETQVPEELTEQKVMPDVDEIVAESNEEREIPETEEELEYEPETTETESSEIDEVDRQLSDLESESSSMNPLKTTWKDKTKSVLLAVKDFYFSGASSEHIDSKIDELNTQKDELQTRIKIIQDVKDDILSNEYRNEHGIKTQLDSLKRVDVILSEPKQGISKINEAINTLNSKKRQSEMRERMSTSGVRPTSTSSSVFPSFGEIMHPEKLRNDTRRSPEKRDRVLESANIFPSFGEIMHPERLRKRR
jgi:hypothetical protein